VTGSMGKGAETRPLAAGVGANDSGFKLPSLAAGHLQSLIRTDCEPLLSNIKVIQLTFYVSSSLIVLFFTPLLSIQLEYHLCLTSNSSFVKIVMSLLIPFSMSI
jgi:hypothetical protein